MTSGISAPARALQSINVKALAIPVAAVALGGAAAYSSMSVSKDNRGPSRTGALVGAGVLGGAALLGGAFMLKNAGGADGIMGGIRSALGAGQASRNAEAGIGLLAAGAGITALGTIGGLTNHVIPAAQQNYNTISRDSVTGQLPSSDRALLAAVSMEVKGGVRAAIGMFKDLSADTKVADATSTTDRVHLTAAALEAGVSAEAAGPVIVGTHHNLYISSQDRFEIEDPAQRNRLAAAAVRGLALGSDAKDTNGKPVDEPGMAPAFKFQNLTDALPDTAESTRVDLAVAALEGQVPSANALAVYSAIAQSADTASLSETGRKTLAEGALRAGLFSGGGIDPDMAIRMFDEIQTDGYLGKLSTALSADQQAQLAAAAIEKGTTAEVAATTLVNAYSDQYLYDNTDGIAPALEMATAALRSGPEVYRSGEDVASVFKSVSTDGSTKSLSVDERVQLAAAWLESGHATPGKIADVYGDFTTKDTRERIMLSAGEIGGLDVSSPSTVLDGYFAPVS